MKFTLWFGSLALLTAMTLIFGRATLAGKTNTQGDVVITERNELWEERLYLIGVMLGGMGIVVIFASVAGIKSTKPGDDAG